MAALNGCNKLRHLWQCGSALPALENRYTLAVASAAPTAERRPERFGKPLVLSAPADPSRVAEIEMGANGPVD